MADFLRYSAEGVWTQGGNLRSLYGLVRSPLLSLGAQVEPFRATGEIGDVVARRFQMPLGPDLWSSTFWMQDEDWLADELHTYLQADLVLGFELSPFICSLLAHLNIPFINFGISPVRFCGDIFLTAESQIPAVSEVLQDFSICQTFFYAAAGRRMAKLARTSDTFSQGRIGVITGQTPADRVVIKQGGGFHALLDYRSKLEEWASGFDLIVYKPHPLAESLPPPITNAQVYNGDIYSLMGLSSVSQVISLSSSTSIEAKYFDADGVHLIDSDKNLTERGVTIDRVLEYPAFWSSIFSAERQAIPMPPKGQNELLSYREVFQD